MRKLAAEFLGTFALVFAGTGAIVINDVSGGTVSHVGVALTFGLIVLAMVYAVGDVSGAHLNPAVTLALAVHRGFPWSKVLPFWGAQVAGAFAGASVTFVAYREAFDHFDHGLRQVTGAQATAGIFATYPQPFLSNVPGGLVDQVVGTALLLLVIFALGDAKNQAPEPRIAPLFVGGLVILIGMTFGYNAGYAINPARDLGPRLFTALAGWGSEVFRAGNSWWWVPIMGPLAGGVVGGFVYDLFITRLHPRAA